MDENQNKQPLNPGSQNQPPGAAPFQNNGNDPEKELSENFQGSDVPKQEPVIKIRTMKDDVSESAGETPAADTFSAPAPNPPAPNPPAPTPPVSPPPPPPPSVNPSAPPKPDFETEEPVFQPQNTDRSDYSAADYGVSSGRKKLFIIIGIVIGVLILGVVGYLFIIPALFPPLVVPEEPAPTAALPPAPVEPETPSVSEPEILVHKSFFLTAPDETVETNLRDLNYSTIQSSLTRAAANNIPDDSLKEIVLKSDGSQFPFADFLSNFSSAETGAPAPAFVNTDQFEKDFTAFLYYDSQGVWPGYIAKMKGGVTAAQVMLDLQNAEPVLNIEKFYLTGHESGALGEFKDGQAKEIPTRYLVGANAGAAFNYGVFGDYLVLSTSYNGLLKSLSLLGL